MYMYHHDYLTTGQNYKLVYSETWRTASRDTSAFIPAMYIVRTQPEQSMYNVWILAIERALGAWPR